MTNSNPSIGTWGSNSSHATQYKDTIVSLDIGTTKMCVIVSRKGTDGQLDVLGIGTAPSRGLNRGVINNVPEAVESIRKAIKEAEINSGMKITKAIVGIAGQHIKSDGHRNYLTREVENNEITQRDVDELLDQVYKIVLAPGERIIHVLPQSYKVDNEEGIINPVGMVGTSLQGDFLVITGNTNSIETIHRCVTKAGIEVGALILEPIASSVAVLNLREKEAGVALIDIGGGTTDLAIFQDGIVRHTAVIPFGGNIITEDVRVGCEILREDAELLKTTYGSALSLKEHDKVVIVIPDRFGDKSPHKISKTNLSLIIQARVEEIMEEVFHHISKAGYSNGLLAGIVLTGGGSLLKNIDHLTEYMTGIRTRNGNMNAHLNVESREKIGSPQYATAVGLALMGIDLMKASELKGEFVQLKEIVEPVVAPVPIVPTVEPDPIGGSMNASISDDDESEFVEERRDELETPKPSGGIFAKFKDFIKQIKEDSPDYES